MESSGESTIIQAGATGDLGFRIASILLHRGVPVKALVRKARSGEKVDALKKLGVTVVETDFDNIHELTAACSNGFCVISAMSGLRDVIIDAQSRLLEAAVKAGVPRFIPSDYSIDFTKLPYGSNRNLDLRREFSEILDRAPIKATSVLNGMFMDLLTGQAPVILTGPKLVVYWGDADQPLDFTTIENTAAFTVAAALDPTSPRYLRIAGEVATINDLKRSAEEATGEKFRKFRPGGLGALAVLTKFTKTVFPQKKEVFPAWQGMQYLHNMFTGLPKLSPLDNNRYTGIRWTSVAEVLQNAKKEK